MSEFKNIYVHTVEISAISNTKDTQLTTTQSHPVAATAKNYLIKFGSYMFSFVTIIISCDFLLFSILVVHEMKTLVFQLATLFIIKISDLTLSC